MDGGKARKVSSSFKGRVKKLYSTWGKGKPSFCHFYILTVAFILENELTKGNNHRIFDEFKFSNILLIITTSELPGFCSKHFYNNFTKAMLNTNI